MNELETQMQLIDEVGAKLEEQQKTLRIARTLALHANLDVGRYDNVLKAVGASLDDVRAISVDLADEYEQIMGEDGNAPPVIMADSVSFPESHNMIDDLLAAREAEGAPEKLELTDTRPEDWNADQQCGWCGCVVQHNCVDKAVSLAKTRKGIS